MAAWLLLLVLPGAAIPWNAAAQDESSSLPTFEVSTVRPNNTGARASNLNFGTDEIRSSNLPILFLLQYAYKLNAGSTDQIIGAPTWISSVPFDIVAKMDSETAARIEKMPPGERDTALRRMVQGLLADRFQLKVHHESREIPVFALTVAKGGSKLTAVSGSPIDPSKPRGANDWTGLRNRDGFVEGRDASLKMLVDSLSWKPEIGGRLVVDETGLQGNYNFTLRWTPDDRQSAADPAQGMGSSIFTALEEQLGLKLESKKAPVDCIVIDHVERPSAN
jgi:uncharacterized protein (TIGR03435 family)